MATLTLDIKFNEEGFLVNANDWTEDVAKYLAEKEGLMQLTDRHWAVINFMRKEYKENGEVPTIRRLKNAGGVPTKELYELFPSGPAKKAARIAGLPKPKGCV